MYGLQPIRLWLIWARTVGTEDQVGPEVGLVASSAIAGGKSVPMPLILLFRFVTKIEIFGEFD